MQEVDGEVVKENVMRGAPLRVWWLVLGALGTAAALLGVAYIDAALPAPLSRDAPAHRFIADIAHDHLVNLTAIGPRVRRGASLRRRRPIAAFASDGGRMERTDRT